MDEHIETPKPSLRERWDAWWAENGITRHFLKGWRTRIFAAAVGLLGILDTLDPYMISSIVGYRWQGLVVLGIGLLTYVLREMTDTAPGSEGNTESWWASTAGTPRNTEANSDEGASS
jgi:hypothetical protein